MRNILLVPPAPSQIDQLEFRDIHLQSSTNAPFLSQTRNTHLPLPPFFPRSIQKPKAQIRFQLQIRGDKVTARSLPLSRLLRIQSAWFLHRDHEHQVRASLHLPQTSWRQFQRHRKHILPVAPPSAFSCADPSPANSNQARSSKRS